MRPQAIESEQQVLAEVFAGRAAFADLATLTAFDFMDPTLRGIFMAMQRLQQSGEPWTPIELIEGADAETMRVIGQLMAWPMSGAILSKHIARLKDAATRRAIIDACNEMALKAAEGNAEDALSFAQTRVMGIAESRTTTGAESVQDVAAKWLDEMDRRREAHGDYFGVPSGFSALDRLTGGFEPGEVIVIAGRPGSGKTTLGMNIVQNAAKRNTDSILVFSMEMNKQQLMTRLAAGVGRIDMRKLMHPKTMGNSDFASLHAVVQWVHSMPVYLDDTAGLSSGDIAARARLHKQKHGLQLVVVDYLGLVAKPKGMSTYEAVTKDSAAMKTMAKMLNVPVILLAQMNRAVESRTDPRPKLSDLRDSGSIEQDADAVIFVHRPNQHKDDEPDDHADIYVAKNRKGETGTVRLMWRGDYNLFVTPDYTFENFA